MLPLVGVTGTSAREKRRSHALAEYTPLAQYRLEDSR